jgi:Trypsin-like peptidase domain
MNRSVDLPGPVRRWSTVALLSALVLSIPRSAGATAASTDPVQTTVAGSGEHSLMRLVYKFALAQLADTPRQVDGLTRTEAQAFGGIGAIVCIVAGARRSSTAFLVGSFEIAVTVAHTFERKGVWARLADCVYHTADRWGQIRERIPIKYVRAQWQDDPTTFGQATKDLAVVRLSRPSRFAQRTLSFSKFVGSGAPVMLIGFRADPDFEPLKHKRSGRLFNGANHLRASGVPRLVHDMDTGGLASGAPVLDRRDGVVIGIHARVPIDAAYLRSHGAAAKRNAMLIMTDWLERILRAEIESSRRLHLGTQVRAERRVLQYLLCASLYGVATQRDRACPYVADDFCRCAITSRAQSPGQAAVTSIM